MGYEQKSLHLGFTCLHRGEHADPLAIGIAAPELLQRLEEAAQACRFPGTQGCCCECRVTAECRRKPWLGRSHKKSHRVEVLLST